MPRLTIPLEEAAKQIQSIIDEGQNLLHENIRDRSDLAKARAERNSWTEYVQTLLQRNFDNDSISKSFIDEWMPLLILTGESSLRDDIRDYQSSVNTYLRFLTSLLKRLHLFSNQLPPTDTQGKKVEMGNTVFVVHGQDDHAKESVARLIEKLGLRVVILHEQLNQGRTIIDKLLDSSEQVDFAVVLLTPDDVGARVGEESSSRHRARQNVILELGLFLGLLGKQRVCTLKRGDIELPTDFQGVVYLDFDDGDAWKLALARELQAVWDHVDLNEVFR